MLWQGADHSPSGALPGAPWLGPRRTLGRASVGVAASGPLAEVWLERVLQIRADRFSEGGRLEGLGGGAPGQDPALGFDQPGDAGVDADGAVGAGVDALFRDEGILGREVGDVAREAHDDVDGICGPDLDRAAEQALVGPLGVPRGSCAQHAGLRDANQLERARGAALGDVGTQVEIRRPSGGEAGR